MAANQKQVEGQDRKKALGPVYARQRQGAAEGYSGMTVSQNGNFYRLYLPQQICVSELLFPNDGQYVSDSKALQVICRALSHRWGVGGRQHTGNYKFADRDYSGLGVVQTDISAYTLYYPNGMKAAWILTPPDGAYINDCAILIMAAKAIARRTGLI